MHDDGVREHRADEAQRHEITRQLVGDVSPVEIGLEQVLEITLAHLHEQPGFGGDRCIGGPIEPELSALDAVACLTQLRRRELAARADQWMRAQNLLDEARSGARHAHDEDRRQVDRRRLDGGCKGRGRVARDDCGHARLTRDRLVDDPTILQRIALPLVRAAEKIERRIESAAGLLDARLRKLEMGPVGLRQAGTTHHCGQLRGQRLRGCRRFHVDQAEHRIAAIGAQAQSASIRSLRPLEISQSLGQIAREQLGVGTIRKALEHPVARRNCSGRALRRKLRDPEADESGGIVRSQAYRLRIGVLGLGPMEAIAIDRAEPHPRGRAVRLLGDGLLQRERRSIELPELLRDLHKQQQRLHRQGHLPHGVQNGAFCLRGIAIREAFARAFQQVVGGVQCRAHGPNIYACKPNLLS